MALVDGTGGTRKSPDIFVTTVDAARLSRVLRRFVTPPTRLTEFLLGELQRAVLVEPRAVSQTIVTMNSRVRFRLDGAGEAPEIDPRLSWPRGQSSGQNFGAHAFR